MAVTVTHQKVSAVPDSGDSSVVQPSDWNADHTIVGLGSAAEADVGDFATATQGAKADTAVQPGDLAAVATSGDYDDLANAPTLGSAAAADATDFATAAQGGLADTAVQPSDLAAVATSGDYDDLANTPTLGTAAAADAGDFATAAQGALADTAVQPGDLATVATTGAYGDLSGTPTLGDAAAKNTGTAAGTVAAGDDSRFGTVPNGYVTPAKMDNGDAVSVLGRSANSSGTRADIAASANDRLLARVSNALSFVQLTAGMIANGIISFAHLASSAIASQGEAEAGSASNKLMTPQRTAQAIAALGGGGGQPIPSNHSFPVGMAATLVHVGSLNISSGGTTAGSNLRTYMASTAGAVQGTGAVQTGTWKNIAGTAVGISAGTSISVSPFVRTA